MPILSNPKHERFAQELAKGKTAEEAYRLAGYKESRKNASRMKTNEDILGRVSELQNRAAERTVVTVEGQTAHLMRIAAAAEALKEASGLAVARAAHVDIAKINGLIVDRKEIRTGELDDVNADELRALRSLLVSAEEGGASRSGQSGTRSKPH